MKAIFMWLDGPFADHSIKKTGPSIPLGPKEGVEVPGFNGFGPWALVEYDQKHYYLTDKGAPGGILVNEKPAPSGQRVELLSGTEVRFGAAGPRFRFGFEIEPEDLLSGSPGKEYSPSEAIRRMQDGLGESAAKKGQVVRLEQTFTEAGKKEKRRWGGTILAGLIVGLIVVIVVALKIREQSRRTQETTEKLNQLTTRLSTFQLTLNQSQKEFQKLVDTAPSAEDEVRRAISELEAKIQDLEKKDPAANKEEIARLKKEIESARAQGSRQKASGDALQRAYEKSVPSLVFIVCEIDLDGEVGTSQGRQHFRVTEMGFGTGFVVGDGTQVLTCKHVTHPWNFPDLYTSLAKLGVIRVTTVGYRIKAWKAQDEFVIEEHDQQPVIRSKPRWSTADGTIKEMPTEDELATQEFGPLRARIEKRDENDVAVLVLKGEHPPALELAPDEEFRNGAIKPLARVLVAGFPMGNLLFEQKRIVPSPAEGTIRKIEKSIMHTAPTCHGNSGGPLLDEQGRVIGMVRAGYLDQQGVNLGVPATRLRERLGK